MEDPFSTSTHVVTSADAAAVLLNAETQKLLHPFFQEKTAAVAAKELGMSTSALLYRLNKLVDFGVLKIVREEPRAGRASKVYRTTSNSFFVPFHVTQSETLEAYLEDVKRHYQTLLTANIAQVMRDMDETWGMRIYKDDEGKLQTLTAKYPGNVMSVDEEGPAIFDFYYPSLKLEFEDAKALQKELGEVFQRYVQKQGPQKYLIHIGLVPLLIGAKE